MSQSLVTTADRQPITDTLSPVCKITMAPERLSKGTWPSPAGGVVRILPGRFEALILSSHIPSRRFIFTSERP